MHKNKIIRRPQKGNNCWAFASVVAVSSPKTANSTNDSITSFLNIFMNE